MFKRFRRIIIAVLVVTLLIIFGYIIWLYIRYSPIDLAHTDLSKANSLTQKKAAEQLKTPIAGLRDTVSDAMADTIEHNLGYILRQKYGQPSANMTASLERNKGGYDNVSVYTLYATVFQTKETYVIKVNTISQQSSVACASPDMQTSPTTCTDISGVDDINFPKG